MKKLFLVLIAVLNTGTSLFAWEPNDLTKFPPGMDSKSWILNLGVGLFETVTIGKDYIYIPPVRLSLDRNVEIGDNKLPFFIGGILGYRGYGYKDVWFDHKISMGGRLGYHFNWGVKNLDTYAVTTAGYTFYTYTGKDYYRSNVGEVLWGVNLGARYFISKGFGFWIETGYTSLSWLDIGFAFKF